MTIFFFYDFIIKSFVRNSNSYNSNTTYKNKYYNKYDKTQKIMKYKRFEKKNVWNFIIKVSHFLIFEINRAKDNKEKIKETALLLETKYSRGVRDWCGTIRQIYGGR